MMQGISEAAFSLANFLGPIGGSHVAAQGSVAQGAFEGPVRLF